VGITVTRQGTVNFDRAKFLAAYADDPAAVAAIFEEKGTSTTGDVRLVLGSPRAQAGTYGVEVTAAATKATATGTAPAGGSLKDPETITISSGGKTATYVTTSNEAVEDVATGLNTAFATDGLGLVASVESGALVVRSAAYGDAATFTVDAASTANRQSGLVVGTYKGTNVAGQFRLGDGTVVAATGKGNVLSAGTDTAPLFGLAVEVFGAPVGASITYSPGLARRLEGVGVSAVDTGVGVLKLASDSRKKQVEEYQDQIESWDTRLAMREAALRKQFNAMEVALGRLRDQSTWLSGQLASLF
jgi:flagellar hook-associated protein 2